MSAEFDGIAWAARETALRQCVGHIRPATASASGEDQEKSTARTESTRDAEVRQ